MKGKNAIYLNSFRASDQKVIIQEPISVTRFCKNNTLSGIQLSLLHDLKIHLTKKHTERDALQILKRKQKLTKIVETKTNFVKRSKEHYLNKILKKLHHHKIKRACEEELKN